MRNVQFNWERSLIKNAPQFTSYILFCYASSITNEGLQTNLVTHCHLFPVIMTSFTTAASLLLEPLMNMHLTICHTLFKTNCHINFNLKRFCLNRHCEASAGWKIFLNIHLLLGGKLQASCATHSIKSWPVSATISKTKLISKFSRYIDSHHHHHRLTEEQSPVHFKWSTTVLVLGSMHNNNYYNVIFQENGISDSAV